ncbi:MAG TPA: DUF3530 family protein [Gammaproteobacteria bacterium]|nr:DUF3530 family protein [Gammaproteobacteria bacterium]
MQTSIHKHSAKSRHLTLGLLLLVAPWVLIPTTTQATNYHIEHQYSQLLQNSVDAENIVWLNAGLPLKTLGLFQKAQGKRLGTVIILPDLNQHPDWPQITHPLRIKLSNYGWDTLSIQMPIKETNASLSQLENIYQIAAARITAAMAYLRKKRAENIIVLALRHSANIAIRYLAENLTTREIRAIISISAFDSSWINSSPLLQKITIPFLDIIAQNDQPAVLRAAPKRLVSAHFSGLKQRSPPRTSRSAKVNQLAKNKTGNLFYRQVVINGANPQFSNPPSTLIKTIRGWLKSLELNQ